MNFTLCPFHFTIYMLKNNNSEHVGTKSSASQSSRHVCGLIDCSVMTCVCMQWGWDQIRLLKRKAQFLCHDSVYFILCPHNFIVALTKHSISQNINLSMYHHILAAESLHVRLMCWIHFYFPNTPCLQLCFFTINFTSVYDLAVTF